jgi:hypothetical protein
MTEKESKETDTPTVLSYALQERDNEFLIYLKPDIRVIFHGATPGGIGNVK